jgi:hypothetical protein
MKAIFDWIDSMPLTNVEIIIILGLICFIMFYPYRSRRRA